MYFYSSHLKRAERRAARYLRETATELASLLGLRAPIQDDKAVIVCLLFRVKNSGGIKIYRPAAAAPKK
jgi:hypothetical protein